MQFYFVSKFDFYQYYFLCTGVINDTEDSCGPMGVGDLFMDESNDDLVQFLQQLSSARLAAVDYLSDGHLIRPPLLNPAPIVQIYTSSFDKSQFAYDTVLVQAWQTDKHHHHQQQQEVEDAEKKSASSIMIMLVGASESAYEGDVVINPADWTHSPQSLQDFSTARVYEGLTGSAERVDISSQVAVTGGDANSPTKKVTIHVKIPPRSVKMLEFVM